MTTSTSPKFIWWEKSVEYQFIADAVQGGVFSLLVPFDGEEERVGDAVFAKGASYIIVEFKKDLSGFESEYKKYKFDENQSGQSNFETAKLELIKFENANHHLLVSGSIDEGAAPKLIVEIFRYFSCSTDTPLKVASIQDAAKSGVSKEVFDNYVLMLSRYKSGKSDTESGAGSDEGSSEGGITTAKSIVVGVNPSRVATIVALEEYSRVLKMELAKKPRRGLSN